MFLFDIQMVPSGLPGLRVLLLGQAVLFSHVVKFD